jgi:hypothetical protein
MNIYPDNTYDENLGIPGIDRIIEEHMLKYIQIFL